MFNRMASRLDQSVQAASTFYKLIFSSITTMRCWKLLIKVQLKMLPILFRIKWESYNNCFKPFSTQQWLLCIDTTVISINESPSIAPSVIKPWSWAWNLNPIYGKCNTNAHLHSHFPLRHHFSGQVLKMKLKHAKNQKRAQHEAAIEKKNTHIWIVNEQNKWCRKMCRQQRDTATYSNCISIYARIVYNTQINKYMYIILQEQQQNILHATLKIIKWSLFLP